MKLKSSKKLRKRKSRTFLVLPILEPNNNNNTTNTTGNNTTEKATMPKNPGLKLFTKTWPTKRDNKENHEDDESRPLTATLERPAVLDINLLGKVDMSTVTKEFFSIGNLCRIPLAVTAGPKKRKTRPLSLPVAQKKASGKRNRRCETSEDSWEEEESLKSARLYPKQSRTSGKVRVVRTAAKKLPTPVVSDANNNTTKGTGKRVQKLAGGRTVNVKVELEGKAVATGKLPEPCKTCGRPDQPERFHSHPATPVKPVKKLDVPAKIPVKSIVQKPMAIRYKSKQAPETKLPSTKKPSQLPVQKLVHTPPNLDAGKESPAALKAVASTREPAPAQKVVHTPPNLGQKDSPKTVRTPPSLAGREAGSLQRVARSPAASEASPSPVQEGKRTAARVKSAKRTLTCYLCGREFGTASLPLHEPKCLERWKRENANLPAHLRRKLPPKPDHPLTQEEWDKYAWETAQAQLIPCERCGRTFFPDRLTVHQRSCKETGNPTATVKMALEKSKSIEAELQTVVTESAEEEQRQQQQPAALQLPFCQKVRLVMANVTVEPTLFLYILPCVMANIAVQNLSLEKACRVNIGLEPAVCDAMAARNISGYSPAEERLVQRYVSSLIKYKNLVQSVLPAFLLLFVGSWSDRHERRKPCMILPIAGEVITVSGLLICTYFLYELPLEVNVFFEAVPPAIFGGWFVMFMGLFSYISSITSVETRTLRIGAVNVFANISITIGTALSGLLFAFLGFYGIFSLSLGLYLLGILYICLVVKEDVCRGLQGGGTDKKTNKKNFVADFFDWRHVADTFRTVFRNDKHNKRRKVAFVMGLAVVIIGPVHGEMNIAYMFVRHKFHWNEIDYSLYTTFHFIVHFIGTVFSLTFFSKYLKLDDALLGIISCTSKVLACAVYALAPSPMYFYAGALVEILNGTSFIALRSIVTKLVKTEELGKINSLFGMFEALAPIVYGPLYSYIYQMTIEVLPGAFYIAGGLLTLPAIAIFFWLYRQNQIEKKEEQYATGENLIKNDLKNGTIN